MYPQCLEQSPVCELSVNSCGTERGKEGREKEEEIHFIKDVRVPPSSLKWVVCIYLDPGYGVQGRFPGSVPFASSVSCSDTAPPVGESLLYFRMSGSTEGHIHCGSVLGLVPQLPTSYLTARPETLNQTHGPVHCPSQAWALPYSDAV